MDMNNKGAFLWKKLWYAVKSGRKPGLFTSWDDCKLQVIRYPGASYKGFFTKEEAMEFLGMLLIKGESLERRIKSGGICRRFLYSDNSRYLFVWGCLYPPWNCWNLCRENYWCRRSADAECGGEIHGAVFAMGKCLEKGISEINLYYDYVGIEKWCTGEWKANKRGTKALRSIMN